MVDDRVLASVDIMGASSSGFECFAGRTLLAEFLFHSLPESDQKSPLDKAADEAENDALPGGGCSWLQPARRGGPARLRLPAALVGGTEPQWPVS
jgi:hypothetical protein